MSIALIPFLLQVLIPVETRRDVVILVNEALPVSVELGEYYAMRRGIPRTQILSLKTSIGEVISWPDYREQIEKPLRRFLETRNGVKYIVPIYGIPVKTKEENKANDRKEGNSIARYVESRDYCCIDREIELLRKEHPLEGWLRSETFQLNRSITKEDGVFIVCRLDGPSPASVRRMIDNALYGETYGVEGSSFLDTRGLSEGTYATIDREMANIAEVYRKHGIPFAHDNQKEVVPLGSRPGQAHYWGWYTTHVKVKEGFRFNRGAVGAHLHSFSAGRLRKPDKNWVGPLVHLGITGTCGTVYEPLSSGFPFGTTFLDRFFQGYNFGESMQMANMFTSWMAVFVGDPLYAPYAEGRAEVQARNRALVAKGPDRLKEALDGGRLKDAEKVVAEISALFEYPVQGEYIRFLVREVRARSLFPDPVSGSVGELWKVILQAEGSDALRHARNGLSMSPNNFECNRTAGEELLRKKKTKQALEHLQRAIAVDPGDSQVQYGLGRTLLLLKKPDEALSALEEAYRLDEDASILIDLGKALLEMRKFSRALEVLKKGSPSTEDHWSLLARAYRANGERQKAKAASTVARSFAARKRADTKGSRRKAVIKRVQEVLAQGPGKLPTPLEEEGSGLPILLLANKSGWTIEVLIDGSLVRSETLRSLSRPRVVSIPLYAGKTRIVLIARKGKEEKRFGGEVLFEMDRVYSLGFESLTKLYPLKK